jgi:hypothetical protein
MQFEGMAGCHLCYRCRRTDSVITPSRQAVKLDACSAALQVRIFAFAVVQARLAAGECLNWTGVVSCQCTALSAF